MRIAEINMLSYGSTGNIMLNIACRARREGVDVRTYSTHVFQVKYKRMSPASTGHKYYGTYFENGLHFIFSRITGFNGCYSYFGTQTLILELKKYKPDIIHLHNLHQFCMNLPALFQYIKKHNIPVIWTLHDCWSFTGYCPHFVMVECNKWKTGCSNCPQYQVYPKSYIDNSERMYKLKKKWFTNVHNMIIVSPSKWLADLVRQSYLKNYSVRVINNGIDLNIFKPTSSNLREKYGLTEKYVVLGVAFDWGKRKGLDMFIEISQRFDERFRVILVGTNDKIDVLLPKSIISIHFTQNQKELAEIYSAADIFVNPTREEVLGLVNIESLACGTPVITFDTGGSPECIDETCGIVIPSNNNEAFFQEIIRVCETKPFSKESCLKRAQHFDMNDKFTEYVKLYRKLNL